MCKKRARGRLGAMSVVPGLWKKYTCDGCRAHALAEGDDLPPGWKAVQNPADPLHIQHACSEECADVLAWNSDEPTPTSSIPIFAERCVFCGATSCDGHEEPT